MRAIESLWIENDRDVIETYRDQGFLISRIPGETEFVLARFLVPANA